MAACLGLLAQDKVLTLQECIDLGLKQNPQILSAGKAVERAKAMQGTAWDIDKTELSLSQDPTSGGSPDNSLSLSQGIEFPTVYIARHKQLKAETQAEESRQSLMKTELIGEIAAKYYQIIYEQERLRILGQQDSILTRYLHLAEKRYQAGEIRKLEVLTAERLLRENKLEMATAQSETENVRLQMATLLGTDLSISPIEKTLSPVDFVQAAYHFQQTPEGRLANDQIEIANRAVTVAKNGYAPSLSLSLRNQLVITSWNPYHQDRSKFDGGNFMGFEVGVGIPIFYGATKAKVKAAKKEREMAQMEMERQRQAREKEYLAGLSQCNAAFARLDYYRQEGEPKARELVRLGTMEYENGEIGYVEYINALQESIDIRMKHAAAINDYNQCVVALQRLTGSFSIYQSSPME